MGYGLRNDVFGAWVGALYTLLVLREGVEARDGYVRRQRAASAYNHYGL